MTMQTLFRPLAPIAACSILSALLLAGVATSSVAGSANEYRLHAGDVLEIVVAGMPELKQRVTVQVDGGISLPLLGTITVAGSTTADARAKIQAALATKVFRYTAADGRERPVVIKFDEVSASVVEYRPIYVQGDVMKPGELTYRPHMTVRQAVGAAGGYYTPRFQSLSAAREIIDVQGEYASLWVSLAKERLLVWRLTSELGEATELDSGVLDGVPLPAATLTKLKSAEVEYVAIRKADYANEKAYLERSIAKADEHIIALEAQQKKEDEGIAADIEDLERLTSLFNKGSLAMPRLTESRRALLLSTTRQVQTRSQLIEAQRRRGELMRQLEKLPDQHRLGLLKELQEARVRLGGIQTKLQTIGEQLPNTMKHMTAGPGDKAPRFTVFRKNLHGERTFAGDGDTELQPGDVVEVVLMPAETTAAQTVAR